MEHWLDKERKCTGGQRSDKGVGCDGAGAVAGKGIHDILEGGLEYGGKAKPDEENADDRRPRIRDMFRACP